jgi:FkbM family methyltransferase
MSSIAPPPNSRGQRRVIYDLGANNGDDIPYYLLKSDLVVAVEASPVLAAGLRQRFGAEIAAERVRIETCALTVDPAVAEVPFYLHRTNHLLSQLPRPAPERLAEFDQTVLSATTFAALVALHGDPFYVKIDLEGYDDVILQDLFRNGVFPPYVSAEAHTIDVFCTLVALGGYDAFKLVEGEFVGRDYASHPIATDSGTQVYAFPSPHSSGPFGNDIPGPWMDRALFLRYLAHVGPGWIDIHASRVDSPGDHKVRKRAEIGAEMLHQVGMRLGSHRLTGWGRKLWGIG